MGFRFSGFRVFRVYRVFTDFGLEYLGFRVLRLAFVRV